jgi:pilus assembly protein CpaC
LLCSIADARAISDRQLVILGKKIGATNVLLYDTKRQLIGVVDVEVKLDTAASVRRSARDPAARAFGSMMSMASSY